MNTISIFLDDSRDPIYIKDRLGNFYPDSWVVCRNFLDFKKAVDHNFENINLVSFDHDLSDYDKSGVEFTGVDACQYLIDKCIETGSTFPNWYVHTSNTSGRSNIINDILNYLRHFENKKYNWIYYYSGIIDNHILV